MYVGRVCVCLFWSGLFVCVFIGFKVSRPFCGHKNDRVLTVSTSADLIDDSWLQINQNGTLDVLIGASLGEEGVE